MKYTKVVASVITTLILFSSCSHDTPVVEKKIYPDITLIDARYKLGQESQDPIIFDAEKMEMFLKEDKAKLTKAKFEQTKADSDELFVSGSADDIDINTRTYKSSLSGNVNIILHEDNNSILADSISWDKEKQNIQGTGTIVLDYGDIKIEGENIEGNLKDGVFTFRKINKGTIIEEKEAAPQEEAKPESEDDQANASDSSEAEETAQVEEE